MVSDKWHLRDGPDGALVSIRFEVRGGFRLALHVRTPRHGRVSIRFEVRGGFRLWWKMPEELLPEGFNPL